MITKKKLLKRIKELEYDNKNLVNCDVCGCLLRKSEAIQGNSRILGGKTGIQLYGFDVNSKETIKEVYYCGVHGKNKKRKPINK